MVSKISQKRAFLETELRKAQIKLSQTLHTKSVDNLMQSFASFIGLAQCQTNSLKLPGRNPD